MEPFNKSLSCLLYCQVILWSMSACSFETRLIPFHNTPLWLIHTSINCNGLYNTGIYNTLYWVHICWTLSSLMASMLLTPFVVDFSRVVTLCSVCTGHISVGHSPSVYIVNSWWNLIGFLLQYTEMEYYTWNWRY